MRPIEPSAESPTTSLALCVSIHDVAPATWPECERLLQAIYEVADIRVSLLVVPDYHGLPVRDSTAYERMLEKHLARGDELVLHGWRHLDEAAPRSGWRDRFTRTIYTRREGEFYAASYRDACWRIEQGRAWFAERNWPLEGFVAPAWLLGPGSWRALLGYGFRYTTTRRHFYLLPSCRRLASQSLVYSVGSGWRRAMSYSLNAFLLRSLQGNPLARLSLHPVDARHAGVLRNMQRLLGALLEERDAITKVEFARRLERQPDMRPCHALWNGSGSCHNRPPAAL
jgi:predicted deacetylase